MRNVLLTYVRSFKSTSGMSIDQAVVDDTGNKILAVTTCRKLLIIETATGNVGWDLHIGRSRERPVAGCARVARDCQPNLP